MFTASVSDSAKGDGVNGPPLWIGLEGWILSGRGEESSRDSLHNFK